MQSVLMQCLAGSGEVRAESVVHMGKQGSGDQSPVISTASSSRGRVGLISGFNYGKV